MTVNPASLTVTATSGQNKTYGAADPGSFAYTYQRPGQRRSHHHLLRRLNRAAVRMLGTYAINQNTLASSNSNYSIASYVSHTFAINPAGLTITANNESKTYGSTFSFTGGEFTPTGLKNGETVGSVTLASAGAAAGATVAGSTYTITPSAATGGTFNVGNYTISYVNGAMTVNPASLTVTATAGQNKTYGALDPGSFAYTYSGLVNGDLTTTFSGALNRAAGENVGTYAINQNTLASSNSNYTIGSYVSHTFAINPASLTVTATAGQNKTYGAADPGSFAYTYSGLVNGDLTTTFSGALNRAAGENVGTYAINQNTLASSNSNYTINSYVSHTFAINPASLTVTATAGQNKTYGAADPGSFAYTYSGLVNGDLTTTFSGALNRAAGENVGTYAINQNTLASSNSNYTINSYVSHTFAINPAGLSITANNESKTYGSTFSFTGSEFTPTGLKNGETVGSVTLASAGAAAGATVAGSTYAITPSAATGGTFTAGNYSISYVNGAMTVNPASLTVTATAGQNKTYGAADPGTFAYSYSGLVNGDLTTTFSGALNRAVGENVGTYAINQNTLASSNSNYTIASYVGHTFAINPANLTITANNQGKTYGSTFTFTGSEFTPTGLQNGENVGSVTLTSAGAAAGATVAGSTYAITPSAATGGTFIAGNYSISYVNGAMTVNPASLTVTATAGQSKTYGDPDPGSFAYTYSGLVNGDLTTTFSGALNRAAGENVGTYAINQNTLASSNSNYAIASYVGHSFTIDGAGGSPPPPAPTANTEEVIMVGQQALQQVGGDYTGTKGDPSNLLYCQENSRAGGKCPKDSFLFPSPDTMGAM